MIGKFEPGSQYQTCEEIRLKAEQAVRVTWWVGGVHNEVFVTQATYSLGLERCLCDVSASPCGFLPKHIK